jgi:hypothetical protein
MNHIRIPKDILLPECERQDKQDTKGDRVEIQLHN